MPPHALHRAVAHPLQIPVAEQEGLAGLDPLQDLVVGEPAGTEPAGHVAALDEFGAQFRLLPLQGRDRLFAGGPVVKHQEPPRLQVVQQAGGFLVQVGQVPLDAVECLPFGQLPDLGGDFLLDEQGQGGILQRAALRRRHVHQRSCVDGAFRQADTLQQPRTVPRQRFAGRPDRHRVQPFRAALALGIKHPDGFNFVPEEVQPHGGQEVRRPDVQDAAALCERARAVHHVDLRVARLHPAARRGRNGMRVANAVGVQRTRQVCRRQRCLHEGFRTAGHQAAPVAAVQQRGQGGQPALPRLARPRNPFVGAGVGLGQVEDAVGPVVAGAQQGQDFLAQLVCPIVVGGNDQHGPGQAPRAQGQGQGTGRFGNPLRYPVGAPKARPAVGQE